MHKFPEIFDGTLGLALTVLGEHHIETGDWQPISCLPRRVSLKERKPIQACVDEMLQVDVIEPSNSPWSVPMLMV